MGRKSISLFQNISRMGWRNLLLTVFLTTSIMYFAYSFINARVCENIAVDYCAYYSTGKLINQSGYNAVYDLEQLTQNQKMFFNVGDDPAFEAFGMPYLPVFLVPFSLLSFINLPYSYYIWTFINLFAYIAYLIFFITKIGPHPLSVPLILVFTLSVPFMINIGEGQYNVWLVICVGEFLRHINNKNDIIAGLWLGGCLLKPQMLLLILPFLVIHKFFRVLKGFSISSLIISLFSFVLIGPQGIKNLMSIIFESASGGVRSAPQIMINWRIIGFYTSSLTDSTISWLIIIAGSILTLILTFYILRKTYPDEKQAFSIRLLGIFTASLLVTWHSHVFMMIILYPILIYLVVKNHLNFNLLLIWIFAPLVLELIFLVFAIFLPIYNQSTRDFVYGARFFILNILLLGWTFVMYSKMKKDTIQNSLTPENEHI